MLKFKEQQIILYNVLGNTFSYTNKISKHEFNCIQNRNFVIILNWNCLALIFK